MQSLSYSVYAYKNKTLEREKMHVYACILGVCVSVCVCVCVCVITAVS